MSARAAVSSGGHGARGPSRRAAAAVGGLALAAFVGASWAVRFAGQGTGSPYDTVLYFFPLYAATYERVGAGTLPLWNPYQLCGIPWLGTLQGGFFHPLHVLYVVLPLHVAFALSNVLHLVLIAVATAAFARRLGLGPAAAVLAALVFGLRGRIPFALFAPNYLEAVAWLPVGAFALVDLVRRPGPWPVALLATAAGMSLLAGYPQPTAYVVYAWGSLLLALLIDARAGVRRWAGAAAAFGGAMGLGAMLAAVQMLPALELTQLGTRATEELGDKAMFPMSPLVTPAHAVFRFSSIAGTPFAAGIVALALAPVALVASRRPVLGWWAVALTVVSGAFGLGKATPLFSLYLALPGLRWFRNPDRILAITDFGLALAAAYGLDGLLARAPAASPAVRRLRVWLATLLAALAAVMAAWLGVKGWAPPDAVGTCVAFAGVALVLLAVRVAWGAKRPSALAAAFVVAVAVEISLTPWHDMRLPYDASDTARYELQAATFRRLAAEAGHERVWRFAPIGVEAALKVATLYRMRATNDYEPLNLQRQADFFNYLTDGTTARTRPPWLFPGDVSTLAAPPGVAPPATRRRLLDLAAVRLFVVPAWMLNPPDEKKLFGGRPDVQAFVAAAGFSRRAVDQRYAAYWNADALPRAFVTYRARSAPQKPDDVLAAISRPDFDPLVESLVEGPSPLPEPNEPPLRGRAASFVRDDEAEVELEATLDRPGLVVLADSVYPGWHAAVDGEPAPILATNYLFRGVPVPAGTHRVRFVYAPASVRLGALLSGAGLVVVAILLGLGWRRRRRAFAAARAPAAQV